MSQQRNIKRWLERIASNDPSQEALICDTLLKLRPYSKKPSGIKDILQNDGIAMLLKLLQRTNQRILDISISILANCLTEDSVRQKVFEDQGVPHIVRILQCVKCSSILSRVIRSIGNLAHHENCVKTLYAIGGVELLVELVKSSSLEINCIIGVMRAFKNLANAPSHHKQLVQCGVVSAITRLMPFERNDLATSAVQALSAISRSSTIEFADHMLSNEGAAIAVLVKMIHDNTDNHAIKDHALMVLENLTLQACTRPVLGSLGGIDVFMTEMKIVSFSDDSTIMPYKYQGPLPENAFRLVSSLCYCCREAINRARLRSLDALPVLIHVLKDQRWQPVHLFTLKSLLCFVYDEEGLKILHENDVFGVLLQKLEECCLLEMQKSDENKDITWDGHDEKDQFDRRQSLSYDIPTKFNDKSRQKFDIMGKGATSNPLDVTWENTEDTPAYSPQWSPVSQSPILDDLAIFASESNYNPDSPQCSNDFSSQLQHHFSTTQATRLPESDLFDLDESSSSRDGYDIMLSPALLPISRVLEDNSEESRLSADPKRDVAEPKVTVNEKSDLPECRAKQTFKRTKFSTRDETLQSKRFPGIGGSQDNDEKISSDIKPEFSSPARDGIHHEITVGKCSPSFLQFVNETYSNSNLLEHDKASKSVLKQPKRKLSGQSKVSDVAKSIKTATSHTGEISPVTLISQLVPKASQEPLPKETVSFSMQEEPSTLQVVLYLLCHCCEVSDSYVTSLCQQDNCAKAISTYLRCCKSIDVKAQRIIDKLTSCSESFNHIIVSYLVPILASACCTRKREAALCLVCKPSTDCTNLPDADWFDLLDNMWHNVALIQSSLYGSNLIDSYLYKCVVPETRSATVTALLLTLWYDETGKLCNISDELRKKIYSNLKVITDKNYVSLLLQCLLSEENPDIFEAICHAFHKLASRVKPFTASDSASIEKLQTSSEELSCRYIEICQSRKPDKELGVCVTKPSATVVTRQRSLRKRKSRYQKADTISIPIHSDIMMLESPMFAAMLTGSYRESSEKMITLTDTSYCASVFVVHLLYGCNKTTCPQLKEIFNQVNDQNYLYTPSDNNGQRIELEILKLMDLWLIHKKNDFLQDLMNFFMENHVRPEVLQHGRSSEHACEESYGEHRHCGGTESTYFWDYICMHKYDSIARNYVELFCSACCFQHNHVKHGKAFVHLHEKFQESTMFHQAIQDKLDRVILEDLLPKLDF